MRVYVYIYMCVGMRICLRVCMCMHVCMHVHDVYVCEVMSMRVFWWVYVCV